MRQRLVAAVFIGALAVCSAAAGHAQQGVRDVVAHAVRPVMEQYAIPGMAVGIVAGSRTRVFTYGVVSLQSRQPVTAGTLFEIGSVSKTFAATLAADAQLRGAVSLSAPLSRYWPSLQGKPFGAVTLLELGTHTPGGLPLQVPEGVKNLQQWMQYLGAWRAAYPPGTVRTYNNPGIGTLGLVVAQRLGMSYGAALRTDVFGPLGMTHSFVDVPKSELANYAQGYTSRGVPVRMEAGFLAAESYGVRSTVEDLVRFVEANLGLLRLDPQLQRGIMATHTGFFSAGPLTQDLIWEQYPYPVALARLERGNGATLIFDAVPVHALKPPHAPSKKSWVNKTGSTDGFSAYIAFIPVERLGIVMLANKNYPIAAQVAAAFRILNALAHP